MHKRLFDFVGALLALLVLSPLILFIAALLRLSSNDPVLYVQKRVGSENKVFRMLKFRTMTESDSENHHLTIMNDKRVTVIGKFLRRWKLDELPQLFNVLKGDMSIVGPRPELPRYVEKFKEDYRTILSVKPGMTDYASIAFRNESQLLTSSETYEKDYLENIMPAKITIYRRYIDKSSIKTDLHIILKTIASFFYK